jgi:hypothetical protein
LISTEEILEALDLSRAEPGAGYLEALFARFNARVPFENISKIVRNADVPDPDARPRTPEIFWADHLALGTGGTCYARVAAFGTLLEQLGFRVRRVLGRVRQPDDHAALLVESGTEDKIADVGFPLSALLPASPGFVETSTAGLRVSAPDPSAFDVEFEGGVPDGPRSLRIGTATAPPEQYLELWRRSFRPGAILLKNVTLRRDLGNRILAFTRGEVRVDDLCSRLTVPLGAARAPAIARLFDVDEALVARGLSIAGDPEPAAPDAKLTAYFESDAAPERAYAAIASREGYARLLRGVAEVEHLGAAPGGFRVSLSAGGDAPARLEEDVAPDPSSLRVDVVRRSESGRQLSAFQVRELEGRTWLTREATLAGPREDLLRNDSLRGRLAGTLAVDLLAWSRLLRV